MKKHAVILLFPFLNQCADKRPVADPGLATSPYHLAEPVKSLKGVKIPVMQSFQLEKRWGKPSIRVLPNGGYALFYMKPGQHFESLNIYGAPGVIESDAPEAPTYRDIGWDPAAQKATVRDYTQKWHAITLFGRRIHYYTVYPGGGADPPEISTVTFSLKPTDGSAASYRISATSNLNDGEKISEGYLQTVDF